MITGHILERKSVRYTPAGIAMLDVVLQHESVQQEAGIARAVQLEIGARAADRVALDLDRVPVGGAISARGFLGRRNRNSRSLVFSITEFQRLDDQPHQSEIGVPAPTADTSN